MSSGEMRRASGEVIEPQRWLRERIEAILQGPHPLGALEYITHLLRTTNRSETRLWCFRRLGMLTFRAGNLDRAHRAFAHAAELSPEDPGIAYALAHCEAARGRWWRALMHSLEAFHHADIAEERAEFLRVAGIAVRRIGIPDTALSMALGALDRDPDNPWVLQTIGHFYESEQMWMEAIGVRDRLIDVLSDGLGPGAGPAADPGEATDTAENPEFYRVFRAFAVKFRISEDAIRARRGEIRERLRSEIAPADRVDPRDEDAPPTPLRLPRGLDTLVDRLARHDRNYQLLESAQSLWARARHDRFDVELTPNTLAAAIQWVVERLHWREPTPLSKLSRVYSVVPDTLRAAARLVVGRFDVRFVPLDDVTPDIGPAKWDRLDTVQKALLYGVDLDEVRPSMPMLGE